MRAIEDRRKTEIRKRILKKRDGLSEAERCDKSKIIWSRVVSNLCVGLVVCPQVQ